MNKRKIRKCLLSIVIVCLISGIFAGNLPVFAATSGDYEYNLYYGEQCEITKYSGAGGDITVPLMLDGYRVSGIGPRAFANCRALSSVTIPNSVTYIGTSAFANCGALSSVTIPNSVTNIGDNAFANCGALSSVTIPNGVTYIDCEAFANCGALGSVTIPNSVTNIGDNAFRNSGVSRVYFDGKPTLGEDVFAGTASKYYSPNNEDLQAGAGLLPITYKNVTTYSIISIDSEDGVITPSTASGMAGETISLQIKPDEGYTITSGTLNYNDGTGDVMINETSFVMPDKAVTISAAFEPIPVPTVESPLPETDNCRPTWSWDDATGKEYYRYRLNNESWRYTVSNSFTPTTDLAEGTYTLEVQGINNNGDWSSSGSFTVAIKQAYTINIGTLSGGSIIASSSTAKAGDIITLTVTPDVGKQVKVGTLKYDDGGVHDITGTSFTMPAANVTVTAEFEDIPSAPTITNESLASGTVNEAYKQTLTATGDSPITWSLAKGTLPAGLNLDAATGAISGTPTAVGTTTFTIKASNGVNLESTKELSITIDAVHSVKYTVSFDSNGGNSVAPITDVTSGSTITLTIPTRSSYSFEGWFEGDVQYSNTTPITKNVTLTAKWKQNISGGGSTSNSGSSSGSAGSSSNQASSSALNAEQVIDTLSKEDKEAIINPFKEYMPYTSLGANLTLEQLKALTNNKFTDKQLQEMLDNPGLFQKLGIDYSMMSTQVLLKPIQNPSFTDVNPVHWAYGSISEAASLGLVAGMPDGSFVPNNPLQVEDTFVFLDRVLLLNNITEPKLPRSTVEKYMNNKNHWAFSSMASIASKLSEPTLKTISERGNQPLSRELLAQILYEITEGKLEPKREEIPFIDIADSHYKAAISYCTRAGLLNGMDSTHMAPNKVLTRAELMSVLIRLNTLFERRYI